MQNWSYALKSNVNAGPIVFSKGVYNNLPADTSANNLVQTYPFTNGYYAILKSWQLLNSGVDLYVGDMHLHADDFERNYPLSIDIKTGEKLTTVKYVQDTVARWATYAAFSDIDASGNKIRKLSEMKFQNNSALTESGVDLLVTVPGDLKISADEVNVTSRNLNVKNISDDPAVQNEFAITHLARKQAIKFNTDGSISFKVGIVNKNGGWDDGKNTIEFDNYGRIKASIISPVIDVLLTVSGGAITYTLDDSQELPSAFGLKDVTFTLLSQAFHNTDQDKYFINSINLPPVAKLPPTFVYTMLIMNNTTENIHVDADNVMKDTSYYVNFNNTLTISPGSACSVTISKSGNQSIYVLQFNLLVSKQQAILTPLA
jgi:hypothetical protein